MVLTEITKSRKENSYAFLHYVPFTWSQLSAPSKMHWRGLRKPPYYTGLANISIDKF